jgi:hypothetical protein
MGGKPRNRPTEEATISAAADRLLTGIPLRSTTGKLTVSGLISESGLRRDVVYEHTALVDAFKAQAQAQQSTPLAMQQLAAQHAVATRQLAELRAEPAAERAAGSVLRKTVAELSLELQNARDQVTGARNITSLRRTGAGAAPAR